MLAILCRREPCALLLKTFEPLKVVLALIAFRDENPKIKELIWNSPIVGERVIMRFELKRFNCLAMAIGSVLILASLAKGQEAKVLPNANQSLPTEKSPTQTSPTQTSLSDGGDWLSGSDSTLMFHVQGTFVDSDGQPMQAVMATAQLTFPEQKPQAIEITIDGSKFGFKVPAADWHFISIKARNDSGDKLAFLTLESSQIRKVAIEGLELKLEPTKRAISIKVLDGEQPVADAEVKIMLDWHYLQARSNASGIAVFNCLADQKLNQITAWQGDQRLGGFSFTRPSSVDPAADEHTVQLVPSRPQKIRIVDEENRPVLGVPFTLNVATPNPNYNYFGTSEHCTMTSDQNGEAIANWFPAWDDVHCNVEVLTDDWMVRGPENQIVDGKLLVRLQRTRKGERQRINGRIRCADEPPVFLGGYKVSFYSFQGEVEHRSDVLGTFTNPDGTFSIDVLPDATYCYFLEDSQWVSKPTDMVLFNSTTGNTNEPLIEIKRGHEVEITATQGVNKQPMANQMIHLGSVHGVSWSEGGRTQNGNSGRRWSVVTDANGKATTRAVDGNLVVSVFAADGPFEGTFVVESDGKTEIAFNRPINKTAAVVGSFKPRAPVPKGPAKLDLLGDPLPPFAVMRLGTTRFHPNSALDLELSVDEKRIFSFSGGALTAWDVESGQMIWKKEFSEPEWRFSAASYGLKPIASIRTSAKLVTPGPAGSVFVFDMQTGDRTLIATDTRELFKSIDVSPDGKTLALGGAKRFLVCDLDGKKLFQIENRPNEDTPKYDDRDRLAFGGDYSYARFSPTGECLAFVNSEAPNTIKLLNPLTGEIQRKIELEDRLVRMDFSPDGKQLATTERDISAALYDVATGEQLWKRTISPDGQDERYTSAVAFSPTGDFVVVGASIGSDERIRLLNVQDGNEVGNLIGHSWKPWSLQFTANGERLYSTGWDKVIRRWDMKTRSQIKMPKGELASGVCAVSPNGKYFAFVDDLRNVHIVDAITYEKVKSIPIPEASLDQLAFSDDGKLLAGAGGGGGTINLHLYIWNLDDFSERNHWQWPKGLDSHAGTEALSISRDGTRLAVCSFRQSAAYVWDLSLNQQLFQVRHGQVYGVSLSPDGKTLATAGWDKTIRLWDCATGAQTSSAVVGDANQPGLDTRMYGVDFSPDGSRLATADMSGMVRCWDNHLNELLAFKIEGSFIYGTLNYSPNGLWVATGNSSGNVAVYDAASGGCVWNNGKHENAVYNVDFATDSRYVLSGASDGVCYLWDLCNEQGEPIGNPLQSYKDLIGENGDAAYRAYRSFQANPATAVETLRKTIPVTIRSDVEGKPIDRWISELSTGSEEQQSEATEQLLAMGFGAFSQLQMAFASATSEDVKLRLTEVLTRLESSHDRFRRACTLLAELDSPDAVGLLDELIVQCNDRTLKKMLFDAKKYRTRYWQLQRRGDAK